MAERYMVLETTGEIRWIETEREDMIQAFTEAIGCEWLENVRTVIPDVCMIVDEEGKVKAEPQELNARATGLYWGGLDPIKDKTEMLTRLLMGKDPIVGPVVFAAIHLADGEPDWVPLNELELRRLKEYSIG